MNTRQPRFRLGLLLFWLLLLAVGWTFFGPVQLGGPTAYVIVAGNSMEPRFKRGDLVVMRRATHYAVGDAVTYYDPRIGRVFHRIIGQDGDHFILQGDNNSWLDPHRPLPEDIIGQLWYHLPGSGRIVERLRTPTYLIVLSLLIGVAAVAALLSNDSPPVGDRRAARRLRLPMDPSRDTRADWLFLWGTVALAALLLAVVAFTRPVTRTVFDDLRYEHQALFDYTAAAPAGVYDRPGVQTGDPIFRRLTSLFTVDVAYRLSSTQPARINGRYRLLAQISDNTGWRRTLELQPETPFSGHTFQTTGQIELADVQALIDSLESQAGVSRSHYTLSILADVVADGVIGDQPLADSFRPRLTFRLENLQLYLVNQDEEGSDPRRLTQSGTLKQPRIEDNTLLILGFTPRVSQARWLSAIGLVIAALALAVSGRLFAPPDVSSEAGRIRARYPTLIVTVRDSRLEAAPQLIDVNGIEDLVRLAEGSGRVILHEPWPQADAYYVQEAGVTYRYLSGADGHVPLLPHTNSAMIETYDHTLAEWVRTLDLRNKEAPGHSHRVTDMFMRLARALGVAEEELVYARWGALLHDIGSMKVPDEIMQKPGALTDSEWEIVRQHPVHAQEMLATIPYLRPAVDIPYCHHERWDGAGYPRGLRGEEIPLVARIFAVVDVWDRLTSDRAYSSSCSLAEAEAELLAQSGQQFDPAVVTAFLKLLREDEATSAASA